MYPSSLKKTKKSSCVPFCIWRDLCVWLNVPPRSTLAVSIQQHRPMGEEWLNCSDFWRQEYNNRNTWGPEQRMLRCSCANLEFASKTKTKQKKILRARLPVWGIKSSKLADCVESVTVCRRDPDAFKCVGPAHQPKTWVWVHGFAASKCFFLHKHSQLFHAVFLSSAIFSFSWRAICVS